MADALIIIDMQRGVFATQRYDAAGLVVRLNRLARNIRENSGRVIWVQHQDATFKTGSAPWQLLPELDVQFEDIRMEKTACDGFYGSPLMRILTDLAPGRAIFTGCATDFCVDTTVRTATTAGLPVWVPSDGHTTSDRPHASAQTIIAHHNFIWSDILAVNGPVRVAPCREIETVNMF